MPVLNMHQSLHSSHTNNSKTIFQIILPTMASYTVLLLCTGTSLSLPSSRRQLASDQDLFREDAVFLSPTDRQARQSLGLDLEFPQLDESFNGPDFQRQERDGGSHGSAHGRRTGRRNGAPRQENLRQQPQQNRRQQSEENFEDPEQQEVRGGRQTGATGQALGVLNNTPTADGSYDFK